MITANSAQVNVDNDAPITSYTFTVTALNNGVPSESGISNPVVSGFAVLPWSEGFDSEDVTGFFTVLDGNGDGKKWSYYNGLMRMGYNTQMAMDDWLITPPMRVQANYSYRVTLKARSANTRYPERIEVKWGNSNTAAAMTHELIPSTDLTEDGFYTLEGVITHAENGTAYIGIHGISDADTYYLEIDDITVEAGLNTRAEVRAICRQRSDRRRRKPKRLYRDIPGRNSLHRLQRIVCRRREQYHHPYRTPQLRHVGSYGRQFRSDIPGR